MGRRRVRFNEHIVVVGLGNVGARVAQDLHFLGSEVVAIEKDEDAETLSAVRTVTWFSYPENQTCPLSSAKTSQGLEATVVVCLAQCAPPSVVCRITPANDGVNVAAKAQPFCWSRNSTPRT